MYLRLVVLEFDFLIFVSGATRGCEEVSQPCLGDMGLFFPLYGIMFHGTSRVSYFSA